jgi:hypothetical protein
MISRGDAMIATLLALLAAAAAPTCPPATVRASRFQPGEQLKYRLDVVGADVGTFEISTEAPPASERARAALLLRGRAKTNAFVNTNIGRYEVFVTTLAGPDLMPVLYKEELDEGETHRSVQIDFQGGQPVVKYARNGQPEALEIDAGPALRDLLTTFYFLRGQPLKAGQPICAQVFAARKTWHVTGSVAAREKIETPLGRFEAVRIDTLSVREDDTNIRRTAHIWVTEDDRRVPLVAIGDVKGKTIRAQLTEMAGTNQRTVSAKPERNTPRVGAGIGR